MHQSSSGSVPGCDPVRMPRARVLLFCLLALLVLALVLGVYLSDDTSSGHVDRMPAADLTKDRVRVQKHVCCGFRLVIRLVLKCESHDQMVLHYLDSCCDI